MEELAELLAEHLPVELTIKRRNGKALKIYFQNMQGVRDFYDFLNELIENVKKKTAEEVKFSQNAQRMERVKPEKIF